MHISRQYITLTLTLIATAAISTCLAAESRPHPNTPVYTYEIVNKYPHNPRAFTQGLAFSEGFLYEGTGRYGYSTLAKLTLKDPNALLIRNLHRRYFGEGITVHRDRIIQLTWKSRKAFVYNKKNFQLLQTFTYPTQGWGITTDGKRLIISDGTATLHLLDPNTFKPLGTLSVHDNNTPVRAINELEYVKGTIYANIWKEDRIAIISPTDGRVLAWIDLKGILKPTDCKHPVDVLNGIAYDQKKDRLFVTGKLWPRLFEIKLIPPKQPTSPNKQQSP